MISFFVWRGGQTRKNAGNKMYSTMHSCCSTTTALSEFILFIFFGGGGDLCSLLECTHHENLQFKNCNFLEKILLLVGKMAPGYFLQFKFVPELSGLKGLDQCDWSEAVTDFYSEIYIFG